MSRSRPLQNAMSSGEISPLLYSRPDYQRYQTGLRTCNGFIPLRQGGATRAPGTIFRGYTRNNAKARLIDFEFSQFDALTLEFTAGYMRVWRYGSLITSSGQPYELATPYGESALDKLAWAQSADVIYMVDGAQPMQKLSRLALDNWTIAPVDFERGPWRASNSDETKTIRASGADVGASITLTAAGGDVFQSGHVGTLMRLEASEFTNVPLWAGNAETAVGNYVTYDDNIYRLTAGDNTGVNPPIHTFGERRTDASQSTRYTFVSDLAGVVRIDAVATPTSATATVLDQLPKPVVDDPTFRWSEGAWSSIYGYPAAVELFQQSLYAGFTAEEPRTLWASVLGDFENFEPSDEADGSFGYNISGSRSQNAGQWLARARRGIYIGALSEVALGFSADASQRIGPTTFDTSTEATDGASPVQPITPYGYPIIVTKDGTRVQEIRYSIEEDGGVPVELSLPSEHLGAELFLEMIWQSAPQKLSWIRRGNGELAVMLYDPQENVLGWARCSVAGGEVEALSVVSDPTTGSDVLTMSVKREIDGSTVRMIEEQAITYGTLADNSPISEAVHFFAAAVFTPTEPTTTFSVPHLVGETVYAWTDAGEHGPIEVPANGEVSMPVPVSRAAIGLFDATHELETLAMPANAPDGSPIGRPTRIHAGSGLMLHRTAAGWVQAVERRLTDPPKLFDRQEIVPLQIASDLVEAYSGRAPIEVHTGYAEEVSLRFTPYGGAPMTIAGFVGDLEEAGP